jgi:hypothetical protein
VGAKAAAQQPTARKGEALKAKKAQQQPAVQDVTPTDYTVAVYKKYDALTREQRDAVAQKLGMTRSDVIDAIFERTEDVDDAIAAVRRESAKKEAPAPSKKAAADATAAPSSSVANAEVAADTQPDRELTDAEMLAEDISVAETTTDIRDFRDAIQTVVNYAFFVGEDTNVK